jgi:hypothetical protein
VAPAVEAVVQFRRTEQVLQLRPLAWRSLKPLPERVHQGRSRIAIELDANAVWRPKTIGRVDPLFSVPVVRARASASNRGDWVVLRDDWPSAPALPLPPLSPDGEGLGLVGLQVSFAEASVPPGSLRAVSRYVEDNRRGLTVLLARTIDDAVEDR